MYDVALHYADRARKCSGALRQLGLSPRGYVLATVHRAANTDDPNRLSAILQSLSKLSKDYPVVFPVHPRTRAVIDRLSNSGTDALTANGSLKLIDPVGYLDMAALESQAAVIATDSGGVQKEAFFHQTPCVTLREETEWQELIDSGWSRLCPPASADAIHATIRQAIGTRGSDIQPYGDGRASQRIAAALAEEARGRRTEDGARSPVGQRILPVRASEAKVERKTNRSRFHLAAENSGAMLSP